MPERPKLSGVKAGADSVPEEESQYTDFFSAYHTNIKPLIAANGTSVTWPPGWTERQALLWRGMHGLQSPGKRVKQ